MATCGCAVNAPEADAERYACSCGDHCKNPSCIAENERRSPTKLLTLPDRKRGHISLTLCDGVVVGAMGSEPQRFIGLTETQARHLARYGSIRKEVK